MFRSAGSVDEPPDLTLEKSGLSFFLSKSPILCPRSPGNPPLGATNASRHDRSGRAATGRGWASPGPAPRGGGIASFRPNSAPVADALLCRPRDIYSLLFHSL